MRFPSTRLLTLFALLAVSGAFLLSARLGADPQPKGKPGERGLAPSGLEYVKYVPTEEELAAAYQRTQRRPMTGGIYKGRVEPHWFQDNTRFWYRNDLRAGAKEFVLVDAESGKRGPAFDHEK